MRYTKIIFWALVLFGVGILMAAFVASERDSFATKQVKHYLAIQRLGEIARIKHSHSALHTSYARQARSDGNYAAEQLFRTIAFSERVQCRACERAIHNLGGEVAKPIALEPKRATTADNIAAAISLKHRHRTTKSYPLILRSIASKNRYVTRIMVWCDANDTHQIALLKAAATATDTIATKSFEVCPTCGYISQQEPSTPICPQCRTVATTFVRF